MGSSIGSFDCQMRPGALIDTLTVPCGFKKSQRIETIMC